MSAVAIRLDASESTEAVVPKLSLSYNEPCGTFPGESGIYRENT